MMTDLEGSTPSPKRRRFGVGNFVVPMGVSILNEDLSGLEEVVDLDEETVRCVSQEERICSDPKVGSRDVIRVDRMARVGTTSPALAWERHLLRQEIVMSQTVLCVEAIKYLEETFSSVLQSLALTTEFKSTSKKLTSIMKESARLLKHFFSEGDMWLSLPFGIFCSGLGEILNTSAFSSKEDSKVVAELLAAAKLLFMKIVKQGLDVVLERSKSAGVSVDEVTLSYVKAMRKKENFAATVQEWVEYAVKRQDRSQFAHPWLFLDRVQKKVYLRDFDKTLEDGFSSNFRGIGYLARLALMTQDAEDGAVEVKQKETKVSKYLQLIKTSSEEFDQELAVEMATQIAKDNALEAGQFHNLCFD